MASHTAAADGLEALPQETRLTNNQSDCEVPEDQATCNLNTLYYTPFCIVAADPLTESLDVGQVVEHSGSTHDADSESENNKLEDAQLEDSFGLQIEADDNLVMDNPTQDTAIDDPGLVAQAGLSTNSNEVLENTNLEYGLATEDAEVQERDNSASAAEEEGLKQDLLEFCRSSQRLTQELKESDETLAATSSNSVQFSNIARISPDPQRGQVLIMKHQQMPTGNAHIRSSVQVMNNTSRSLLHSQTIQPAIPLTNSFTSKTLSLLPNSQIHKINPAIQAGGSTSSGKGAATSRKLSKDSITIANRNIWVVRPVGGVVRSAPVIPCSSSSSAVCSISSSGPLAGATSHTPEMNSLEVKVEPAADLCDPVPDVIAAETVVMTTPQRRKQPQHTMPDPNIPLGETSILVGENMEISEAILPSKHQDLLEGTNVPIYEGSNPEAALMSLVPETTTYTMVVPPPHESSIREANKRLRDRAKKREQRQNAEYREKEKEKCRERMRRARSDPEYRESERRRDRARRHLARHQNTTQRQLERERDRMYKHKRKLQSTGGSTQPQNSLDQLLKQGIVYSL